MMPFRTARLGNALSQRRETPHPLDGAQHMAKYALTNTQGTPSALTTTYKTQWDLTAATGATTLRRAWIYDVTFGTDGTPADNSVTYKIDRQTTTGTCTTATPAPSDAADAAALITAGVVTTIEPTVTAA